MTTLSWLYHLLLGSLWRRTTILLLLLQLLISPSITKRLILLVPEAPLLSVGIQPMPHLVVRQARIGLEQKRRIIQTVRQLIPRQCHTVRSLFLVVVPVAQ